MLYPTAARVVRLALRTVVLRTEKDENRHKTKTLDRKKEQPLVEREHQVETAFNTFLDMADSSTRWADCSSSGEDDDEGFFDRSDINYRPKPTGEEVPAAAATRTMNSPYGKGDHFRRPDPVGKKPSQFRQQYNTKQQQYRQFGSKGTTTNVSRSCIRSSTKGEDDDLDWKILARKSSKILQNDTSSSLQSIQKRSSSGSGPLESDSMEVTAISWIEKRQMKEQKRIQEEFKKAEQASNTLKEEKRLRLKQQTAGLKAALLSLQRTEPSTAATNASLLDEAAHRGNSSSSLHHDEKKITSIEAAVVNDQTANQEEKTQQQTEPKLQQLDRQKAFHYNQNKQPIQQQAYPTKILSKPRQQELDSLFVSSESCAVENSSSFSDLPHSTTTSPTVDTSAPFEDNDGLDTKNHLFINQSSVQIMSMSEHKNLANIDNDSKPRFHQEDDLIGGNNQIKDSSTTDRYKGKEGLRKDSSEENTSVAPMSLKDEVKVSSIKSKDDEPDKEDHDHSFSLINSRKSRPTKRGAKKEKQRVQSSKKGNASAEKSINNVVMEDEHSVTVRIVMPDGRENKHQTSIGGKYENELQSAAITTTSASPHSRQSKYKSNENTFEKKATAADKGKRFAKPGLSKFHGPEQTADKKKVDANLDQTERVKVDELDDQGLHLTKKHSKEPRTRRGNLQKMPQDVQQKAEPSLSQHADTHGSKQRCLEVAESSGEADLDAKANLLKENSSLHDEDAAKPLQVEVSSLQRSILENNTKGMEISKSTSPYNKVPTALHPSGASGRKSVSFNSGKLGTRPRRGGASFQYRGRPSTDGRRVASTPAVEPKITAQDIPQSVSDVPSSRCLGGLSNSVSMADQVEKQVERDQEVEAIPTLKERYGGDAAITQPSASKLKKGRDRHSSNTGGQSARGRGRSSTPRIGKTPS